MIRIRGGRPLAVPIVHLRTIVIPWRFAAGLVAILVLAEAVAIAVIYFDQGPYYHMAMDWAFYRNIGARWLTDGSFYLPHQLTGTYVATTMVDILYPPHALFLFVPYVFLPAALWWLIPLSVLAYVLAYLKPAPWAWIVMLLLLAWPRSIAGILTGNTDIWIVAIIAAAVRWGWPAVFVTIKPTLAPFLLLGARRPRQTAVGLIVIVGAVAAAIPLWIDYVMAMANVRIEPSYSVNSIPLMLIPVVARLTTTRPPEANKVGFLTSWLSSRSRCS